jgi:hypothetical protein
MYAEVGLSVKLVELLNKLEDTPKWETSIDDILQYLHICKYARIVEIELSVNLLFSKLSRKTVGAARSIELSVTTICVRVPSCDPLRRRPNTVEPGAKTSILNVFD